MAVTTNTITGRIALPDDSNPANAYIKFVLSGYDTDADVDVTVLPEERNATVDASGDISIDLFATPAGVRNRYYSVHGVITGEVKGRDRSYYLGQIALPESGGPYDLNDLLGVEPPADATVAEYIAELAAAVALASGSAASAAEDADEAAASAASAAASAAVFDSVQENIASLSDALNPPAPLSDPFAVVSNPVTTNKFNPAIADDGGTGDLAPAIGTTTANQLYRLRGNTTGTLSAQNATTLWSFWALRKTPLLEASTEYTISCHGAPGGAYFYDYGYLQFFDGDGDFLCYAKSDGSTDFYNANGTVYQSGGGGFSVDPATFPRQITFTTPAASASIAPNMRNITEFTAGSPVTEEHVDLVADNIMLNLGDTALEHTPYSDGTYTPTSAVFDAVSTDGMTFARQGNYAYVKTAYQQDAASNVVTRLLYGAGMDYSRIIGKTGAIDFQGQRKVLASTSSSAAIAAFNQSDFLINAGYDEGAPARINGTYLGGANHGVIGRKLTMASHGKDQDDAGSKWSDGVGTWILWRVLSDSTVFFVRLYDGSEKDKWTISTAAPASATLTHVSGATNTANFVSTADVQGQGYPIMRNYTSQITLDGVAESSDVVRTVDDIKVSEYYEIVNCAKQMDYLIANAGTTPVDYTHSDIETQYSIYNEHSWSKYGGMGCRSAMGVKNAFRRSTNSDPTGFFQRQRPSLIGDSVAGASTTVHLYVPDMASTVDGHDFQAISDITNNATEIRIPRTSCADPSDPASHFCLIGRDGSGNNTTNMLFGYDRSYGLGVPATRAASINDVLFFSSSEKMYPIAIDAAAGDAAAGDVLEAGWFVAPFAPDPTGELTVPGVIVQIGNNTYCYISAHQTLTNKDVSIPSSLNGRAITSVKSHANVTINDSYVTNGAINIDVASGYGDVILKLG